MRAQWLPGGSPQAGTAARAPGGGGGGGAGRDLARHDSPSRVGKREGPEAENGMESGSSGIKKEGERGKGMRKVMGVKKNGGAGEGDGCRRGG